MTYIRFVAAAVSMIAVLAPGGFAYAQRPTESAAASSPPIVPFKIHVPDSVLTDVKRRLAQSRFADEFPDAGWDYGTNLAYLRSLVDYWREKYDWRAQEKRLNAFDQFDALYADSARQPRVMGIPLHPMITGQPLRIKYLARALAHMKQRDKVWFATGSEIVDAYQRAMLS